MICLKEKYNLNKNLRSKLIQVPIGKLSLGKFNNIDCIIHLAASISCKIFGRQFLSKY